MVRAVIQHIPMVGNGVVYRRDREGGQVAFLLERLKNITFIKKLYYLIFLLFVELSVVVSGFAGVYWLNLQDARQERTMNQQAEMTWNLLAALHELNDNVSQYILHRQAHNRAQVEQQMPQLLSAFVRLVETQGLERRSAFITHLREDFHRYVELTQRLFQQMDHYGITHNEGLQGEMRQAVHRVEHLLDMQPAQQIQLLLIRRAEKDFMLRSEDSYANAVQQLTNVLLSEVSQSAAKNRKEVADRLIAYRKKFVELVAISHAMNDTVTLLQVLWGDVAGDISNLRAETLKHRAEETLRYEQAAHQWTISLLSGIVLVLLFTGILLSVIFYSNILRPVRQLTEHAQAISRGAYDCDISLSGRDEMGVLASHLQQMKSSLQQANRTLERQVEERTRQLTQSNQDLQHSLAALNQARDELVESEKVASLGRLVAGFAHEINTPIGIGMGSISALPEYLSRLETLLAADEVDGDALDVVLAKIRQMSNLCLNNLRAVAELVTRFKRTSVDQTSEEERRFNVQELLLDVQSTLQHLFKRSKVEIITECSPDLVVQSQPGALGQVITNLLMNSYKHGFDEGHRAGTIQIKVQCEPTKQGQLLVIWYADNGNGIEKEAIKHIFEPFFTTAKGRGGSGLGLTICYNIVRNQLMGKIVCSSIPKRMTSFLMEIPLVDGERKA